MEVLEKIALSDDLHISPFRDDGITYGTPTFIWSVVVDGGLYVRGYNGTKSRWFQAALRQRSGRIKTADMVVDVTFEPVEGSMNTRIDEVYRTKYGASPYVAAMTSDRPRAATLRITPRT
jgi:hypothetical protein